MSSTTAMRKPVLPRLQTPKTATFPSEMCSTPISACLSAVIKQEQDLKTPITPPSAYTDFLKALTPILASPPTTILHRSLSDDSNASGKESITSIHSTTSSYSSRYASESHKSPEGASFLPPTPYSATSNPRRTPTGLKRLRIPQHSPVFSPNSTTGPSPRTAMSAASSMGMVYSPFSPADWAGSTRFFDTIATPRSACSKPVSVRSVVTRTVTYKRTTPNLEPAPKGKKRKVESNSSHSSNTSVTSDEDTKKSMPPPSSATTTSIKDEEIPAITTTEA